MRAGQRPFKLKSSPVRASLKRVVKMTYEKGTMLSVFDQNHLQRARVVGMFSGTTPPS